MLATLHNLRRYLGIMGRIRQSIIIGELPEFLAEVRALPAEET
jgi:queuine/archaeosine tRNA-ribosyltransferase